MAIDAETFGMLLRQLRRRVGLTQAELGERVGLSGAHISRLEKDQRLPDLGHVTEQVIGALELGHEPRLATRLVELAAESRGQRPPTEPLSAGGEAAPHVFTPPQPAQRLIGREREVVKVSDRLVDQGGRLITLIGPPGVGKTRLALAIAARLQTRFDAGACFVPLAGVFQPAQLPAAVLALLGDRAGTARQVPAQQRLIELLRRKDLLLVLDNVEQIAAAAPLVAEWLAECPGLRVLTTSRVPLRLRAEQRVRVEPLPLADASLLLLDRVEAATGSQPEGPAQTKALAEAICRRLDCLPLAIELVAAQGDLFSLREVLTRLEANTLDVGASGGLDLPARQRTLRHSIRHSYELLAPTERRLFRMLGVFVGSFSLEAAETYGVDETALQHLANASLVQSRVDARGRRRFWLLETLREYALEQLSAHGEIADARRWHAQYCLELAETAETHRWSDQADDWVAELGSDNDNLRAALEWTSNQGDLESALRLAVALIWYWERRSATHDAITWSGRLLDQAYAVWHIDQARFDIGGDNAQLENRLRWITLLLKACPGYDPADYSRATRLLPVFASADLGWPLPIHIEFLIVLGWFELRQGHYNGMYAHGQTALTMLERFERPHTDTLAVLRAEALDLLATHAFATRRFETCVRLASEAERAFQGLGRPVMAAFASLQLGRAALYSGDTNTAWIQLSKSRVQFARLNDLPAAAVADYELGTLAVRVGSVTEAEASFRSGLRLAARLALTFYFPMQLRGLAETAVLQACPVRAAQLLGAMDRLIERHRLHILDVRTADVTRTRGLVQTALSPAAFGAAYAEGYTLDHDALLTLALNPTAR